MIRNRTSLINDKMQILEVARNEMKAGGFESLLVVPSETFNKPIKVVLHQFKRA